MLYSFAESTSNLRIVYQTSSIKSDSSLYNLLSIINENLINIEKKNNKIDSARLNKVNYQSNVGLKDYYNVNIKNVLIYGNSNFLTIENVLNNKLVDIDSIIIKLNNRSNGIMAVYGINALYGIIIIYPKNIKKFDIASENFYPAELSNINNVTVQDLMKNINNSLISNGWKTKYSLDSIYKKNDDLYVNSAINKEIKQISIHLTKNKYFKLKML